MQPYRFWILILGIALLSACGGDDKTDADVTDQTDSTDQSDGMDGDGDMDTSDSDMVQDMIGDGDVTMEPVVSYEMFLDDDVLDYSFIPLDGMGAYVPDSLVANHFVPPADGRLESARIVIANGGLPTGFLEVTALAADGPAGAPGTELLEAALLVQADRGPLFPLGMSASYLDVDFPAGGVDVTTDGFFVAVRFVAGTDAESPALGMDAQSDGAPTWIKLPTGEWEPASTVLSTPITMMIRATVQIPESAVPDERILTSAPRDCVAYQGGILTDPLIGQWATIRLQPPATPFEVDSIRYELREGMNMAPFPPCSATLPHRVGVFVSGDTPASDPVFLAQYDITLTTEDLAPEMTPVGLDLDPPITLQDGEYLYIAVELPGDNPRACIGICGDTPNFNDNWLTGTVDPPFSWTNFDVIPAEQDTTTRAYGRILVD